jgi:hypothetical protein
MGRFNGFDLRSQELCVPRSIASRAGLRLCTRRRPFRTAQANWLPVEHRVFVRELLDFKELVLRHIMKDLVSITCGPKDFNAYNS